MLQDMTNGVKQLIKNINNLCWLSRGYLQYHDAFLLTAVERDIMDETFSERMDEQKKAKLLFPIV